MTPTKVDIVIATYRRPAMLRDTVLSLSRLRIPRGVLLEVLIVDNDSECSAREVIGELAEQFAGILPLRYISEPRVGLSHARNLGIEEARGDIIAFLDDDIFISEDWLAAMLECLRQNDASAVGGRIVNHWESEPDPTVRACENELITPDLGDQDRVLRGRMTPGGGNSLFRRNVLEAGLGFSTELGRVGDLLLSGEDTELFMRLQTQGHAVWYCARGVMRHRIGGERLTQGYLVRRSFWFGYSYSIIDRRVHGRWVRIGNGLARLGKLLLFDFGRFTFASLLRNSRGQLIARCSMAKQCGYLRATLLPLAIVGRRESRVTVPAASPDSLRSPAQATIE